MDASRIYLITGLVRRATERGFWPLFFVRLVTDVGLSPLQLVLLGTVMEMTILAMEIPTGVVADVYSRKWSVVISFFVMGLAMIGAAFATPYWLIVGTQALIGFGNTFESGAETAWITGELGSSDAAEPLILRRGRLQLLAGIVGIGFFAGLGYLTTLSTTIAAIGAVYLVWGAVLALQMPERNFVRTQGEGWAGFTAMLRNGFGQARSISPLRILVIVVFIGGLAKEAIDRLDVQRLVDVGLSTEANEIVVIGVLSASRMLIGLILLTLAGTRIAGKAVVPGMAILFGVVGAGVLMLAHFDVLALAAIGLVLQGGFHVASEPLVVAWTNNFASDRARATVHSFMGQAEAFGEILGGITLGVVAQVVSVPTAMTVSAVLFFGAATTALRARPVWGS